MKKKKGQFALYIGIEGDSQGDSEGDLEDPNTNEIIQRIMADGKSSVNMVFVGKKYKGKDIQVLEVSRTFAERFYAKKIGFCLKFVIYAEINYILQRFPLFDPHIVERARCMRHLKKRIIDDI